MTTPQFTPQSMKSRLGGLVISKKEAEKIKSGDCKKCHCEGCDVLGKFTSYPAGWVQCGQTISGSLAWWCPDCKRTMKPKKKAKSIKISPSNAPQDISDRAWYYEEKRGIRIIIQGNSGPIFISWRKLIQSLERCLPKVISNS